MRTVEPLCTSCQTDDATFVYKPVVIIGNGPSGLSLSYILSGHWPHYNGTGHSDLMLQARLQRANKSLLHADLRFLSQGVECRGWSKMGALLDQLLHPGADLDSTVPSLIDWKQHRPIDHVVIGKNLPGGVWQSIDENVVSLSLSSWMELPGLPFHEFEGDCSPPHRVSAGQLAAYYAHYARKTKIMKYMKRGEVTSVTPYKEDSENDCKLWRVEGTDNQGVPFTYISRNVVLATGTSDVPNALSVPGEYEPYVHHRLTSLEADLETLASQPPETRGTVLIVGAGLSAADAILAARFRRIPVVHVFRRRPPSNDTSLPDSLYPEYTKVKQMMNNSQDYPDYEAITDKTVAGFSKNKIVILRSSSGKSTEVKVSLAAVLIGSSPSLAFIRPYLGEMADNVSKKNPLPVDPWTHKLENGLYALGPLAGENFVRYLVGGAVAVASDIVSSIA